MFYLRGNSGTMSRTVEEILKDILLLAPEAHKKLIHYVNLQLPQGSDSETSVIEVRKGIQEKSRFACPHCNSDEIVGHGRYKGRKRYKCRACDKTFNDLTGTSVSGIHKKQDWQAYLGCMSEGLTLREAAKKAHISFRTSFIWRHKVLSSLQDIGCTKMEGIIESDETFFLFSEKGKRTIKDRAPRRRGGKASKAGINDEHVAVIVATDRHGDFVAQVAGRGRITAKQIDANLGKWIGDNAEVICTDSHRSYGSFARKRGLKHVSINVSKGQHVKDKVYHIQNINSIHSNMKDWMRRFKGGVGSDYMQNYMNWFRVEKKLTGNANAYTEYALTSNNSFLTSKNIHPQLFIS